VEVEMNKQGPGRISWTEVIWNPLKTKCRHGCWYCYADKIIKRFNLPYSKDVIIDRHEWIQPTGRSKPLKIFAGSMTDILGEWVDHDTIDIIIDIPRQCPQHTFQFLTKNPKRYLDFEWPENCWLGATATDQEQWDKAISVMGNLTMEKTGFISCEPLLGKITPNDYLHVEWIILGAMTGLGSKKHEPKPEWIESFLNVKYNIALFLKDNLNWPDKIQEFPKAVSQ
jgi:protein gp37